MNFEQRKEYFRSVWFHFQKKAGTKREPSNAEWVLGDSWARLEIPLGAVLQAIQETGGKPRTLMACEPGVKEAEARLVKAVPESHPVEAGEPFDLEAAKRRKAQLLAELRKGKE